MTRWVPMFLATVLLALGGCGQKGPLYRPEPAPQSAQSQDSPDPSDQNAD